MARRILLADDSVTAQNMGRRILTDAGYELVTVNNGSAALKKIAELKPDIVVLDVYMPGYGGLEVCQRIKESPETARIPVLLTVGKLEPFKPDEARRVGADAFIIKPFEATELLTALTKLEDKIVAGPQPQKSGRFARALAAVEGADFGDKETGWKNRLTIPGPNVKNKPTETEAPEVAAGPARDLDRNETAKPVEARQEFERPIPAGLPADITPEEIAAITAAAASFEGKAGHPTVIPEGSASNAAASMQAASAEIAGVKTAAVEPSPQETPAATLASATESEKTAPAEVAAETAPAAEAISEAPASSETGKPEERVAAELPAAAEVDAVDRAATEANAPEIEKPSGSDAEVMAAIASLAPSNGHGSEGTVASGVNGTGHEAAVTVAAVAAEEGITGPRWIAEAVAISAEESALALEQEMEQAATAKAAAEATFNGTTTATAVEVPTPASVVETAEPAVAASASVVETVATTESVPALVSAVAESAVEVSAVQGNAPAAEPTVAREESAYAAAASAGAPSDHVPTVEAVSTTTASPETASSAAPAPSPEVAPQREAELAAAWQNWKQIRESFVGAPPATPAEEPAAAKTVQEEAPAPAKAEEVEGAEAEVAASEAPGESTAIASIVDTMLAELRPKLVEEIAKKMSSEKKEKEKEKKKKK